MNGIFLQGGGAKGAFQAGAIYRLFEEGLRFGVAAGTSIGAINLYFLLTGNIEKMKTVWNDVDVSRFDHDYGRLKNVIDNEPLIKILRETEDGNPGLEKAYVNYVRVEGRRIHEMSEEIVAADKESRLDIIKSSSLLPMHGEIPLEKKDFVGGFDSEKAFRQFGEDVEAGIYEGYRLDGGIANNIFVEPFIENRVEWLYMIVFRKNFEVPESIRETYGGRITVIEPPRDFSPSDTLRFEKEFCRRCFEDGVKAAAERGLR